MTKAEREEAARKKVCPRCHAAAGVKCRKTTGYTSSWHTGNPMKAVHPERLALIPDGKPLKSEQIEAARQLQCPFCQAEPGRLCRRERGMYNSSSHLMKGIHAERLALITEGEK